MTTLTTSERAEREVFKTLKGQIGVMNLLAVGAKEFSAGRDEDGNLTLGFRIVISRQTYHRIEITLSPMDWYDVKLIKIQRAPSFKKTVERELEMIYCDKIGEVVYWMGTKGPRAEKALAGFAA
jgi:hypothetical protein